MKYTLGFFTYPAAFTTVWISFALILLAAGFNPLWFVVLGGGTSVSMFICAGIYRTAWRAALKNLQRGLPADARPAHV